MKRTLIIKLSTEIDPHASDEEINGLKMYFGSALRRAGFDEVSFDINDIDEDAAARRLLQSICEEYEVRDQVIGGDQPG